MLTRIRELGTGAVARRFRHRPFVARLSPALSRFDTIKIDQSFVPHHQIAATRPVILKSIIAARRMISAMDVVAGRRGDRFPDAVELYQLGCEYAQGFALRRADGRRTPRCGCSRKCGWKAAS